MAVAEKDQEQMEREQPEGQEGVAAAGRAAPAAGLTSPTATERTDLKQLVRMATVDNFQGEESDIVIISLVRSNPEGRIGFLKMFNRVNVLLTRARHGMILFGNAEMLDRATIKRAGQQNPWAVTLRALRNSNRIGHYLPLVCSKHPDTRIDIRSADDFRIRAKEGGCAAPCGGRLSCGHSCRLPCHPTELQHAPSYCRERCQRVASCCAIGEHMCIALCGDEVCARCDMLVPVRLECGHEAPVRCHESTKPLASLAQFCTTGRKVQMPCGHEIRWPCQTQPAACPKKCERMLVCRHSCGQVCHAGARCGSCNAACTVRCPHSKCERPCKEVCAVCVELCVWECEHRGACPLPCGAPCIRKPCDQRCTRKLPCTHQCPSVCGEECPPVEFCAVCGTKGDQRIDLISLDTLQEHFAEPDPEPILVLACGHAFTVASLDHHVALNRYYDTENGKFRNKNRYIIR